MLTETVVCSSKERFGWGTPEQFYLFNTETGINIGSRFICKVEQIPPQVRSAVDAGGRVKAEVGTEPDGQGLIEFKRFVI
jgi:hypothetical protein